MHRSIDLLKNIWPRCLNCQFLKTGPLSRRGPQYFAEASTKYTKNPLKIDASIDFGVQIILIF